MTKCLLYTSDLSKSFKKIDDEMNRLDINDSDRELYLNIFEKLIKLEIENLVHEATDRFISNFEILNNTTVLKNISTDKFG